MGIFVAIAILFILISCVLFLVRTPLAQWGSWQWIFLAFSVLLLLFFVAMVWYSIQTHRERKEEKAERAQQEREARRRQAAITYDDLDILPEEEREEPDDFDYEGYSQVEEGEIVYIDGKVMIAGSEEANAAVAALKAEKEEARRRDARRKPASRAEEEGPPKGAKNPRSDPVFGQPKAAPPRTAAGAAFCWKGATSPPPCGGP